MVLDCGGCGGSVAAAFLEYQFDPNGTQFSLGSGCRPSIDCVHALAYNGLTVDSAAVIPIHPGALNYYREAGLIH